MQRQLPSDDELRCEFGQDIEIRRSFPTPAELKEKSSWIDHIASGIGYEKWMWRSWTGVIIGIIIITPAINDIISFWKPVIISSYHITSPYIDMIRSASMPISEELVLFSEAPHIDISQEQKRALVPAVVADFDSKSRIIADRYEGIMWRLSNYTSLDGRGTMIVAGSWNSLGVGRLIYATDSPLSCLEQAEKMIGNLSWMPDSFILSQIKISGSIECIHKDAIDPSKNIEQSRAFGDRWVTEKRSSILQFYSIYPPHRPLFLINTEHADLRMEIASAKNIWTLFT